MSEKIELDGPAGQAKVKKPKELTLEEIKKLPRWKEDNTIRNIIQIDREYQGKKTTHYETVWYDNGKLRERLFDHEESKNVPSTAMKEEDLQLGHSSIKQAYEELEPLMKKQLYCNKEIHYDLVTLGPLSSYFREVFSHFPYFDFVAPKHDCGKTTGMKCVILASFNGFLCGDTSEPAIFRTIEDSKGSLGLDNIDGFFRPSKGSSGHEDILRLFLYGHTKGIPVLRVEEINNRKVVVQYDPFSMKAFSRIRGIPIELASRSIKIPMLRYPKTWIPPKEEPTEETFRSFRAKMYMYRLRASDVVRKRYEELRILDIGLHWRAKDNALPLLTIASLISPELYLKVLSYLKEETEEEESSGDDNWSKILYDIIIANKLLGQVTINSIRNYFNAKLVELNEIDEKTKIHSKTVANILIDNLGFKRGKPNKDGYHTVVITKERLEELRIFYGVHIPLISAVSAVSAVDTLEVDEEEPSKTLTISESPEDDSYSLF